MAFFLRISSITAALPKMNQIARRKGIGHPVSERILCRTEGTANLVTHKVTKILVVNICVKWHSLTYKVIKFKPVIRKQKIW